MSSALRNETAIDECITLFTKRMRELAAKKEAINLGSFLNFYAHDVIGFVLFGHRFGYLEAGGDVGSFLNALDKAVPFIYVIAAVPNYIRKVLMFLSIFIPGTVGHLQAIQAISDAAKEQTQLRMERSTQEKNLVPTSSRSSCASSKQTAPTRASHTATSRSSPGRASWQAPTRSYRP